jgi:hypothetical protein
VTNEQKFELLTTRAQSMATRDGATILRYYIDSRKMRRVVYACRCGQEVDREWIGGLLGNEIL